MGLFSKKDKDDARRLSSHAAPTPPSTSLPARPATATASSGPDTTPLYARFARAPTGSSLAFPSGRDSQQLTDSLAVAGSTGSMYLGSESLNPDSPHPSSSLSTNLRAERERARVPSGSRFASSALGREFEERRRTDSSSSKRTPQRTQTLPEPYPEPSPTTPQKRPSLSVITPPSKVVLPSLPSPEDIAPPPVPVKSTTTIVPTASPKLASASKVKVTILSTSRSAPVVAQTATPVKLPGRLPTSNDDLAFTSPSSSISTNASTVATWASSTTSQSTHARMPLPTFPSSGGVKIKLPSQPPGVPIPIPKPKVTATTSSVDRHSEALDVADDDDWDMVSSRQGIAANGVMKSKRKMSAGSPSSPSTPSGSKILGGLLRLDKDRSTTPPPPLRPRIKLDTPPEGALVIPPAVIPAGRPIVPTAAPGAVTNVTSIPIRLPSAATAPSAPSPQQERGRTGFVATVESRHESSPARAATPREYSASRRPMTELGRGGEQVVDLTTPRASLETEATARECDSFVLVPSTAPRSKSPYLSPATAGEASSPTSSSGRDTSPLRLATPESPSGRTVNASAFKSVGRQEAAALVALAKEMPQPRVPVQQPTSPATQRIAQSATYGQVLSDEPMAAHTVVQQPTPPHEVPRTPKLTRMVTDEQLPAPPPFRAASPTVYEPKPGRLPAAARAPLLGMTGSAIDLQMNEDEQQPMEDVVGSTRSDRDAALSATTPAKQRFGLPATFTSRLGPGPNGNKSSSTLSVTSPHGGRPALDGNLSASSTSTAVSSSSGHAGYGQTDKGFEAGGLYGRPHSLSFDLPPGAAAPQLATVEAAADDLSTLPADLAAYEASASMASFGQSGHGHENIMPSTSTSSLTSSNVHAIQHHAHSQLPYDDSAAGAASIPQTNSVTSTPRPGPMPQQQSEPRRTNSAFVFVRGAKLVNVPDKGQDPFGSDAARAGRRRSQFLDQAAPDHAVFPVITPPTQVPVSVPVMEPVAPPAKKQSLPSRSVPASPSMPASVPTSPQQKKDKPPSAFASLVSFGRKRSSSTSDAPLNPSESTLKRAPSGAVSDASHSSSGTIRPSNGTRKLSKRLGKPLPPPTLEAVSPSPVDEEPSAVPSQSHAPLPQQAKDDAVMAPPVRKPSLLRSRTAPDERPSPTVSASSAVPPVPALKKSSPPPALSDSSRTHSARKSVTFDDMEQFRDLPRRQPPATLPDRSRLNSSPPAVTEFGVRRDLEGAASIPVQGSGRRHGQVDGLPLSQSTPSLSGLAAQPRGSGGLPSANGEAAAFLAHMRATSPAVTPRRRSPPSTISQSGAMSSPLPMPPPPKIGTSGSWTPPSPSGSSPSTPSGFLPPKMTAGSFSRNSSADSLNNPFYQPTMPPYMRQSSQSDDGHGSPRSVSYHEGSGSSNGKRRGGAAPPKLRSAGPSMEDMSRISQYQQGMLPPMPTMPGIPSSPSGPPMQLRPSNQPAPVSNGKLPRSALATYSRSQRDIVKLPFTYAGPGTYPIAKHLSHPILLGQLLSWIDEDDWRGLWCLSSRIRKGLSRNPELREIVLERFLWSVGYRRWTWRMQESLAFSLADLDAYMRGAMAPEVLWKAVAADRQNPHIGLLAASARSYTRLVIRLRLQAEATATMANFAIGRMSYASTHSPQSQFKSPLYRPGQAPLFRVFVPNPDGAWLSDDGVLACEEELKRADVAPFLRPGDVVWDCALPSDGNIGRLVWDGGYLLDLDYTYARDGDVPSYIHSLSLPPAYFHKIIKSGPNPIIHADLSPWANEILHQAQHLHDRSEPSTPGPEGAVGRWIYRSQCRVRGREPIIGGRPGTTVDGGWVGMLILEWEGTNEGMAEMRERLGAPPAGSNPSARLRSSATKDRVKTWRILRDRSRPGEIWLRAITDRDRLD